MPGSSRQRPGKPKAKKKVRRKGSAVASPDELFERANYALSREDYETALNLLKLAVELDPENVEIADTYGCLLAECGHEEKAVAALRRSVELSPNAGHEKYLYLGQLLDGEEAIAAVAKGVEVLDLRLSHADEDERSVEISQELSRALCSKAELLLSNSLEVESICLEVESLLTRAAAIDSTNPEPAQVLSSLRIEQGRPEEAFAMLRKSMSLWFHPDSSTSPEAHGSEEDVGMESAEVDLTHGTAARGTELEEEQLPAYEFRIETVKLLLELDDTTETALEVAVHLLSENDRVPDTWHLYALCLHAGGNFEDALKAIEDGRRVCKETGMADADDIFLSFAELEEAVKASMSAG